MRRHYLSCQREEARFESNGGSFTQKKTNEGKVHSFFFLEKGNPGNRQGGKEGTSYQVLAGEIGGKLLSAKARGEPL